mgnify:FL=1|jgi:hypothetical protein|tara:strand:- start:14968 stop:15810 length:843 start_codon:yes stop_codon:yes gene_type:complete
MISIVGIGTGASAIAKKFSSQNQYSVYAMSAEVPETVDSAFRLEAYENPEEYEKNIPDLSEYFKTINDKVQVFIVGSSYSSNYSLGILEQIKDKQIDVFYIKPDTELLTGTPKLIENAVFGVLQEYARSGLLDSVTIFSNQEIEKILGNVPIKNYYDVINDAIFSTVHYMNYFEHSEPLIGHISKRSEISRIRTAGMLDTENLEEKWFFDLDMRRDMCYYLCINEDKLASEGGLHKRVVDQLKKKPDNEFEKISYAIYETDHKEDFGFCVAHTNAVQKNS